MRYYKYKELEYPSVTTIIGDCQDKSGALNRWASNCAVDYLVENGINENTAKEARGEYSEIGKKATDIGTLVHNNIESFFLNKPIKPMIKEASNSFQAFTKFISDYKLEPIRIEKKVFGDGWGGTVDFYGKVNDKKAAIDWKTSKAFYNLSMGCQIAAYGCRFFNPEELDLYIVRLDKKTGEYEIKNFKKHYQKYLNIFNLMVELFFAVHPVIRKKAGR